MKGLLTTALLLLPLLAFASSNSCESTLLQLAQTDIVTGDAVYESGEPGEFFLLSQTFLKNGTIRDYTAMLASTNPIVRIMGAYCIIKTSSNNVPESVIAPLTRDAAEVQFLPVGCTVERKTVADIVTDIRRNPDILEWRKNSQRKTPPTTGSSVP